MEQRSKGSLLVILLAIGLGLWLVLEPLSSDEQILSETVPLPTTTKTNANPTPTGVPIEFMWPAIGPISTNFGVDHGGIDIDGIANQSQPVTAVADGIVTFAGGDPCCRLGLNVKITHRYTNPAVWTWYGHLNAVYVEEGQVVKQGEKIGQIGSTGNSTGVHLHFEVRVDERAYDPLYFLP